MLLFKFLIYCDLYATSWRPIMGNKLSFILFCTDHFDSPDMYQLQSHFQRILNQTWCHVIVMWLFLAMP